MPTGLLQLLIVPLLLSSLNAGSIWGGAFNSQHTVYFKDTDYELHVYRIHGEAAGKTLMILGGMHNEPGGYLAADLYVDIGLAKGNLIVVPRANFPSVVSNNRLVNGDMNRKFTPGKNSTTDRYENKVVEVLKELMAESDMLLNLHDGSGFYAATRISELKNPSRWGQSVIADDAQFTAKDGRSIDLKARASRVIDRINNQISDQSHYFHFNNTRTAHKDSIHPEMRSSATFFALTQLGVEAYGVETSKEIDSLNLKVKYQSLVINAFMEELGIMQQNPKIALEPPALQYLLVSVNGGIPHGIPNGKTFTVASGDTIRIEHIAANYERGLIADILGVGGMNDILKPFRVDRPLKIQIKKDQFPCGEVFIAPRPKTQITSAQENGIEFLVSVNGSQRNVVSGGSLRVDGNEALRIEGISVPGIPSSEIQINFLGFVPPTKSVNSGEDTGFVIRRSSLLASYSKGKKGTEYSVVARHGRDEVGRITVIYSK